MSTLKKSEACRLSKLATESLVIPREYTSIGKRAFETCDTPAEIKINEGVTKIDSFAFAYTKPKHWELPDSIASIGNYAFHDSNIRSIKFGDNLERIGSNAFTGNNLKKVILPTQTILEEEAFDDDVIIKRFKKDSRKKQNQINTPSRFKVKNIDKINNFNPSTDTLEIDTDSFGIDSSATFAAVKNKKKLKKLAKKDFDFLYDQKKGGLYFNENGADKGFGDGGIIAILKGAPDLTTSNLEFI